MASYTGHSVMWALYALRGLTSHLSWRWKCNKLLRRFEKRNRKQSPVFI